MATQRYQVLISRTCKMFLCEESKRFHRWSEMKGLRWRYYPAFSRWALNTITRVVISGEERGDFRQTREGDGKTAERDLKMLPSRSEGCSHKPKNASSHQKTEEAGNDFSLKRIWEGYSPADTSISAQ